ncbi:disulfide bond formation protein B [Thiomonas sp.]
MHAWNNRKTSGWRAGIPALTTIPVWGFLLWLQFSQGIEPCKLCVEQRLALLVVGLTLPAVRAAPWLQRLLLLSGLSAAVYGAGIAWSQWRLQLHPVLTDVCSVSPQNHAWLARLPHCVASLFTPQGDCALIPWTLLGQPLSLWSAVYFAMLAAGYGLLLAALSPERTDEPPVIGED